jgi:hypothetical protein
LRTPHIETTPPFYIQNVIAFLKKYYKHAYMTS